jgi:hypothetical protein
MMRSSSNLKLQTHTLIREGVPHWKKLQMLRQFPRKSGKLVTCPGWDAWHQDRLAEWPSVVRFWLELECCFSTAALRVVRDGENGTLSLWELEYADLTLQVGRVSSQTVNCGNEFCDTWTREYQRTGGVNCRPVLSSVWAAITQKNQKYPRVIKFWLWAIMGGPTPRQTVRLTVCRNLIWIWVRMHNYWAVA